MSARDDILKAIKTSGGWKVTETTDQTVLTAQWRKRLVAVRFDALGRVDKVITRYPLPFNAGMQRDEHTGPGRKGAALRFIRGEKRTESA